MTRAPGVGRTSMFVPLHDIWGDFLRYCIAEDYSAGCSVYTKDQCCVHLYWTDGVTHDREMHGSRNTILQQWYNNGGSWGPERQASIIRVLLASLFR